MDRVGIALQKFCNWTDPRNDASSDPADDFLLFILFVRENYQSWQKNKPW